MTTIVILLALAALLLGPKKAVELSRQAGTILGKLKATREDLMNQLHAEIEAEKK